VWCVEDISVPTIVEYNIVTSFHQLVISDEQSKVDPELHRSFKASKGILLVLPRPAMECAPLACNVHDGHRASRECEMQKMSRRRMTDS